MKKSNSKSKALCAFKKLGVVALITATTLALAGLSTSCKQTPTPTPEHEVAFGVEGGQSQGGQSGQSTAGGTLKAKADGVPETSTSPISVEEGKTVTFTAKANDGYRVKGWTLDGKPITEAGTNTEYKLKVSKPATVSVSFLAGGATYTVKHYQERAEGDYPAEPTESETLNGTVDGEASYTAKTYEGFTQKADFTKINGRLTQTGTVLADGKTVVELFYERNTVSLTFHLAGGNIEGKTDDIVKTGKYGTPFTAPAEPAKATGVFKGWKPQLPTPLLFPAKDAEHTAEWTPKALLTLEAGKNTVKVKAKTADGKPITVEGCTVTELANEAETTLTAKVAGTQIALIGELTELNCRGSEDTSNRSLVALDVSGCTALQKLNCSYNQLTALDVQGLTALKELDCQSNKELTALDVQGLKDLQELNCRSNQIPELDVHGLTALQKLDCGGNKLTSLNIQGLTALQKLDCRDNQLTALDVHGLTALQKLNCIGNKLTALNVQGLTALQELNCIGNKLTALNVQGLASLQMLICYNNQLTALNVQGLTALQKLDCEGNQLTALDVSGCTALQQLYCGGNQLSTLNVQGCTALQKFWCYRNQLNAQAMTEILNALPTREASDKAKAVLYTEQTSVTEGNHKDFSQPAELKAALEAAKGRNWKLQKRNASGSWVDI